MRPMPFEGANVVYRLDGEGPDRGVPAKVGEHAGPDGILSPTDPSAALPYALTRWTPDSSERAILAVGGDIELVVLGGGFPPVSLGVTQTGELLGMFTWAAFAPDTASDVLELIAADRRAHQTLDRGPITRAEDERLERLAQLSEVLQGAVDALPPAKPPRKR